MTPRPTTDRESGSQLAPRRRGRHRARRGREDGSSIVLIVVLAMPMLAASFGIAIDTTKNAYLRANMQEAADMAAQSGASVLRANDDRSRVFINNRYLLTDARHPLNVADQYYGLNRPSGPECQSNTSNDGYHRCWQVLLARLEVDGRDPKQAAKDLKSANCGKTTNLTTSSGNPPTEPQRLCYSVREIVPNILGGLTGGDLTQSIRVTGVATVRRANQ